MRAYYHQDLQKPLIDWAKNSIGEKAALTRAKKR
jgi:hypothetical protein